MLVPVITGVLICVKKGLKFLVGLIFSPTQVQIRSLNLINELPNSLIKNVLDHISKRIGVTILWPLFIVIFLLNHIFKSKNILKININ